MATPFDRWTLDDARNRIAEERKTIPTADEAAKYYAGDHWQAGAGWAGPQPRYGTPTPSEAGQRAIQESSAQQIQADTWAEIERNFMSYNAIGEIVDRHVSAVLGRAPKWRIVPRRRLGDQEQPTPDEQTRIDEATQLLTAWAEDRRLEQQISDAAAVLLYAGRSPLRVFIPPDERRPDGTIPRAELDESIARIYLQTPGAGEAMIYRHPASQRQIGIYAYETEADEERAELTYLDGDRTILRVAGPDAEERTALDIGRRLTIWEMRRPALVDRSAIQMQKLINLGYTMLGRNVILAGFMERVLLNAQLPGTYERQQDGTNKFVPHRLPIGPGVTTNLVGVTSRDAQGQTTYASPDVLWRDPVPVATFADTIGIGYRAILQQANQLHYLIADDASTSGWARLVAMSAFVVDLLGTKTRIDRALSWALESALAMAALFADAGGRYADLRVASDVSVDPGPISPDMIRVVADIWARGLIDLDTALEWIGVEDTERVKAALEREQAGQTQRDGDALARLIEAQRQASAATPAPATNGA